MLTCKRPLRGDNAFIQLIFPNELPLQRWIEDFQSEVWFLWSFVPIKVLWESWGKLMWTCLKWIYFDIWLVREKKVVCTFNLICCHALSWWFLFFNNSSNDNKAPRLLLPFESAAEKILCLKYLETEFCLITCISEVEDYFAEHLDGYFSNSLKKLLWLWETSTGERSLFPPKLRYNDALHLGRVFYWSTFYSSIHQTLN